MNIEKAWQYQSQGDNMLNDLLQKGDFKNFSSKMPVRKLKQNLLTGILLGLIITLGYAFLLFIINSWQLYVALAILILFNVWIILESLKLHKTMEYITTSTASLSVELERIYNAFQKWWSMQQRISVFIYPVAISGGFIMGGSFGSGRSIEELFNNPKIGIVLGFTILIFVPLCYYFAKYLFKLLYGNYLENLMELSRQLNEE